MLYQDKDGNLLLEHEIDPLSHDEIISRNIQIAML